MRRWLTTSSLSVTFGLLFLASLVGQAFAGRAELNEEHVAEGFEPLSMPAYLVSPHFAVDVTENWQSEYLQFLLFVLATIWLVQRGSPESKPLDRRGTETDEEQRLGRYAREDSPGWVKAGGWRTSLYSTSLALVMGTIFLGSWAVQSVAGWTVYNEGRLHRMQDPVGFGGYLLGPEFWSRSLQNWQSEFLAVGSMVVLSIYLRQRGSPESKPVGSSHESTGVES